MDFSNISANQNKSGIKHLFASKLERMEKQK